VLVTQDQPGIERYLRQGEVWIMSESLGLDASVPQESSQLSLREVYDKVCEDGENQVG